MYNPFEEIAPLTQLQQSIRDALGLKIVQLSEAYPTYSQKVVLCENYTHCSRKKYRKSPRPESLQRRLLNSAIHDISSLHLLHGRLVDVASAGKRYGRFMGFQDSDIFSLDIVDSPEVSFREDIEGSCHSVPNTALSIT